MSIKRADTFAGPQMTFKFPSEESLQLQETVLSPGPKVQSYYKYLQSTSAVNSMAGSSNFSSGSLTNRFESQSIPTNSNVSYQITNASRLDQSVPDVRLSRDATVIRRPSRRETFPRRQHAVSRTIPPTRTLSMRSTKSQKSEDVSLYERASLSRSHAVKYKVGWLTRLKNMGIKLKSKFMNWRFISPKRAFRFKRNSSYKKTRISLPLERERAQSISELRMATDNQPDPKLRHAATSPATFGAVTGISDGSIEPMRSPPPLPKHRIASTHGMQRVIDQETRVNSMRWSGVTNSVLLEPMDQGLVDGEVMQPSEPGTTHEGSDDYPSSPAAVYDDLVSCIDSQSEGEDDDGDEQELLIRKYWTHYLRKTIAERIESKLEVNRLTQVPLDASSSYDGEVGSDESVTEFEMDDDIQSYASTSASSAMSTEFSFERSDVSSVQYSGGNDAQIVRYQQEYLNRMIAVDVKRASTLPSDPRSHSRHNTIEAELVHTRFMSVVY